MLLLSKKASMSPAKHLTCLSVSPFAIDIVVHIGSLISILDILKPLLIITPKVCNGVKYMNFTVFVSDKDFTAFLLVLGKQCSKKPIPDTHFWLPPSFFKKKCCATLNLCGTLALKNDF